MADSGNRSNLKQNRHAGSVKPGFAPFPEPQLGRLPPPSASPLPFKLKIECSKRSPVNIGSHDLLHKQQQQEGSQQWDPIYWIKNSATS